MPIKILTCDRVIKLNCKNKYARLLEIDLSMQSEEEGTCPTNIKAYYKVKIIKMP